VAKLPEPIEELLRAALVAELTTLDASGRPITHPLIPLYDGERILFTTSVLFAKKLEHIRRNPKVAIAISDPVALPGVTFHRATIQGDAEIDERDLHHGWERVMPLWRAKEPAIEKFLAQRFALPLFFERAVISVAPRRAFLWREGRTDRAPETFEVAA
jgi:nitroimidazol reductase NimA-like FMN-containing flavoprotein (pyridoxamine 5'-phosphate oxidase superfamily)